MSNLQGIVKMKIHEGKLNEFKELASLCMAVVKEKDKNTLRYDGFFNNAKIYSFYQGL
jgi:hypothetical protein